MEAIGRFDPRRARARFLVGFVPKNTIVLHFGSDLVGFYVVRCEAEALFLDHLYVADSYQGRGFGRGIISAVQQDARRLPLPVRLTALKGSPANQFYRRCDFALVGEEEFDNHYEWQP
ncbi:GNAT superfamily N-acetyltransferase [Sphingobium xanthum]|uniref:GNAT family N-acetyltransferase n=1 Tax=Sphingobium xanthum TaxID=1387165 RepID=UPI001C8B8619|nr:GNAT family N-acetyltransferase [Sphingobium xanthum]